MGHGHRAGCHKRDAHEGGCNGQDLRIVQIRLDREDDDCPDVLEHEQSQSHATGLGVQSERLLEQRPHDQRRRGGNGQPDIECGVIALHYPQRDARQYEGLRHKEAEQDSKRVLQQARHDHRSPLRKQAPDVDLQPDQEQQQNQAKLRDRVDIDGVADQSADRGSEQDPGKQEGCDRRYS